MDSLLRGVSVVIGFCYPAYMSFKALEAATDQKESIWLTYWVILGFMTTIETVAPFLVTLIPFYWGLRVVYLVFLMHPKTNGAAMVYGFIKPFLKQHEKTIDDAIAKGMKQASKRMSGVIDRAKLAALNASIAKEEDADKAAQDSKSPAARRRKDKAL